MHSQHRNHFVLDKLNQRWHRKYNQLAQRRLNQYKLVLLELERCKSL
jgi:hypothetical protein